MPVTGSVDSMTSLILRAAFAVFVRSSTSTLGKIISVGPSVLTIGQLGIGPERPHAPPMGFVTSPLAASAWTSAKAVWRLRSVAVGKRVGSQRVRWASHIALYALAFSPLGTAWMMFSGTGPDVAVTCCGPSRMTEL